MFGATIRRLRKQRGLTQEELANKTGIAQKYVSALERGQRTNPSREVVSALAKALQVPVTDLAKAAWGDNPPPESDSGRAPANVQDLPSIIQGALGRFGKYLHDEDWARIAGYI